MRAMRASVLLFVLATTSLFLGCVKDDPVVTGHRDAGPDARPAMVVPGADEADVDLPSCRRCSDTLSTETSRGVLCRKNGSPSSARRLNDMVDCVCYDKCVQECGSYCAGATPGSACEQCMSGKCQEPLAACMADKVQGT